MVGWTYHAGSLADRTEGPEPISGVARGCVLVRLSGYFRCFNESSGGGVDEIVQDRLAGSGTASDPQLDRNVSRPVIRRS